MIANLKVIAPLYGGMGLAREDGTYFVKGAIPEETVEARVVEKKRDYRVAETVSLVESSPFRIDPPCPVFGQCGGCHYQYIEYDKQLIMKQEIICDCLKRIGKQSDIPFEDGLFGEPFRYRKRAQFKIVNGLIGFFRENSHEIIQFNECLLLCDELNNAYKHLRNVDLPPGIRDITFTSGDSVVAHFGGNNINESFCEMLLADNIIHGYTTDDGKMNGVEYSRFPIGNLQYTASSQGFLQSNWGLNIKLAELIYESCTSIIAGNEMSEHGNMSKGKMKRLIDIFGGAGNFSLSLSPLFKEILIIEENEHSIIDGIRNTELNNIRNIEFHHSKSDDFRFPGTASAVIVDPPRVGMTNRTIERIRKLAPQHIFYISCNPATFSRDILKLNDMYNLSTVRLIDMFPQTYHCEIFSRFELK